MQTNKVLALVVVGATAYSCAGIDNCTPEMLVPPELETKVYKIGDSYVNGADPKDSLLIASPDTITSTIRFETNAESKTLKISYSNNGTEIVEVYKLRPVEFGE